MNLLFSLSLAATAVEMATCLICARNLWRLQRETYDRSRRMLALGALLSGLMALLVVLGNIGMAIHEMSYFVLQPWIGLLYMGISIVMVLYPISVVRPDWLTPNHFTFLFLPVLILGIIYMSFTSRWTLLHTPADIWVHVWEPDVIARLASLFLMIPYCLILFLFPYNYHRSSATRKWIWNYSLGLLIICLTHIAVMRPVEEIAVNYEVDSSAPLESDLWARICRLMDQEEVWKDPDLSLSSFSRLCATNVTYLSRVIQQETGHGFKELVNAKRVAGVSAQIEANPDIDVQSAFFNAGFRSRTTAWRNFKDITGKSPAEFKQELK